ncbi:MAG TPA: ABC-F family ATP-binding cassette domain-containing protein, partial [Anaeromyxobacteraceae bacterium]|nr:ABC-F family ATP-binding cassette domain-containing protein [Anaeromyxobacteraceae bacterium]
MSLVTANGLSLAFGPKVLFHDAAFAIGPRDRVGLIGANGSGKSSLLRILAGESGADSGTLAWRRGARAGYLPQDVAALPAGPLVEMVLASVPGRSAVEARLAATEEALHEATDHDEQLELAQTLADVHAELDHFEERYGRHRAERILTGLGFDPGDLRRDTAALSGGWKMRAALAGLLLHDPDLLLLDEPTNHLDIPTLTWFDALLRGSSKALVLISHDREFLNRQIGRVLSLEPEGLRSYAGDYDDYRRLRAEEEERLAAAAERQAGRRAELQGFIDRFGAKATKARQAQSRQKMLDRMEEVQVLEERATLSFRFAESPRSGKEVLRLDGVAKAFGPRVIYRGLSAQVLRGERVAIIGPNGAGKTTLLRLVAGELASDAGVVKLGLSVVPGYYAQHHFERGEGGEGFGGLDPKRTILDTLWDVVPDQGEGYVRSVAGGFLFSGDDVTKPIGVLSGGERARVALARILLQRSNLLLLDEPTNHLDLASAEALIEALKGYGGTMLFVSHNRSFLNGLATRIWEVKDGGIVDQPGNLDDWLYHQQQLAAASSFDSASLRSGRADPASVRRERSASEAGAESKGERYDKEHRRREAEARNARRAREKPLRDAIAELEARIAALETRERTAEAALADPALYQDFARARPHVEALASAKDELARLYPEWESKQLEL